jgi:hypothetical protein
MTLSKIFVYLAAENRRPFEPKINSSTDEENFSQKVELRPKKQFKAGGRRAEAGSQKFSAKNYL